MLFIFLSKWSLHLSHLLELLLTRLQDVVGHVAHVPPSVSYLPPLPWHVQQLQDEMVQLSVAVWTHRGTDWFVSCTLASRVSPFLMVSSLLFLEVKSWITRRYWGSSGLEGHYRASDAFVIKYLLWTWCLYSYLASCGGGGALQLADFCIKKEEKN